MWPPPPPPAILVLMWMIHSSGIGTVADAVIVRDICQIEGANQSITVSDMHYQCSANQTIGYLDFREGNLPRLPDVFTAFPYLLSLEVDASNLSIIDDTTFAHADNLTELRLYNNSLTALGGRVFRRMQVLQKLDLELNRIETLDEDTFSGLLSLRTLDLSSNDIRTLSEGIFASLPKLRTIRLTSNRIEVIDDSTFSANRDLRSIYLDRNRIATIHPTAFGQQRSLQNLELSHNSIRVPDFLHATPNIRQLMINNATVTSLFIPSCIRTIRATDNQIVRVQTDTKASAIEDLILANNRLTHVEDFAALAKVSVLDLSQNAIASVDFSKLANLTQLHQLSLVGNNLAAFNASGIKRLLPKLSIIELSVGQWPSNISQRIIDDFSAQSVYVMNENRNIVNPQASSQMPKATNWTVLFVPPPSKGDKATGEKAESGRNATTHEATAFMAAVQNITGGKSSEEVMQIIRQSQQNAEQRDSMRGQMRNLEILVGLFSLLVFAFVVMKVTLLLRERYFQQLIIIPNPLRRRSRSDDSFNPIFEDRL